jgi:hypothetical protein
MHPSGIFLLLAALNNQWLCGSSGTCGTLGVRNVPINARLRTFDTVREANKPDPLALQFRYDQRFGFRVDASAV